MMKESLNSNELYESSVIVIKSRSNFKFYTKIKKFGIYIKLENLILGVNDIGEVIPFVYFV